MTHPSNSHNQAGTTGSDDVYSRVDYRRFVAWPARIEREWPFLERILRAAQPKRLVDLGCGSGEHSRFLASKGFDVVGIDRSPAMVAKARESGPVDRVRFLEGDITEVGDLVEPPFGAAICLGNTLPHVQTRAALDRMLGGLRRLLAPEAPVLLQILNYDRIFASRQRVLPLNFREEGDEELVFLRLMTPRPDRTVIFTPSTLRYRPGGEPPLEVVTSKNVTLYGWTRTELDAALANAGFGAMDHFGTVGDVPYLDSSPDLVIVAR